MLSKGGRTLSCNTSCPIPQGIHCAFWMMVPEQILIDFGLKEIVPHYLNSERRTDKLFVSGNRQGEAMVFSQDLSREVLLVQKEDFAAILLAT